MKVECRGPFKVSRINFDCRIVEYRDRDGGTVAFTCDDRHELRRMIDAASGYMDSVYVHIGGATEYDRHAIEGHIADLRKLTEGDA